MNILRRRKATKGIEERPTQHEDDELKEKYSKARSSIGPGAIKYVTFLVGGFMGVFLGLITSVYVATLHENDLWFSAIQNYLAPVFFYIYTVFGLQALYVISLYVTSWLLSGTWISGALGATWYILNRIDTTRVEFTIPLRENWSLPFFALQIMAITYYLRPQIRPLQQRLSLTLIMASTFLFCITWQFNQFILLIQAVALFSLDCLDMVPTSKVTSLYFVHVVSLLLVWILQFNNSMLLGSLVLSFILAALVVRYFQRNLKSGTFAVRVVKLLLHLIVIFSLTFVTNNIIKRILGLESDEHIFKFLKAKFGFGATRDFDAKLYLCEEAFGLLPHDTFQRLLNTLILPSYLLVLVITMIIALIVAIRNLSCNSCSNLSQSSTVKEENMTLLRPDMAYNLIHNVLFGLLALSTMRMKYLWTSHMCIFTSAAICSSHFWNLTLKALRLFSPLWVRVVRFAVPISICIYLCYEFWPKLMAELSDLREFYDPDTVELMNWIKLKTSKDAVFAGSMQLLAGIKLCTGRTITNHPHYEDKKLRDRTKQIYQIYSKRSPEEVYRILRLYGTNYIVLEDSICYERRHRRGCRLRDLIDIANGHVMDGPGENDPDLETSPHPRFCDEIKSNAPLYSSYFTRVFKNKTFHVYKLKKKKGKP
ncbi:protein C-mannosyl-transferase DPY19L3 isoform X3 [Mobula birostris]|uniref:protein C-mannosyl-transferase DPY19L3 isoform X3 n=1 Tax=Mobula birostris TaxID=1983395 RepID=UPI003B285823